MQIRTVLIWVVIAGILGAIVVVSRPAGQATDAPAIETWRSLGIDSARIVSLTRAIENQPPQIIERSGAGGEGWIVRWGADEHRQSWPADSRRVRAGNRTLSTQRIGEATKESFDEASGSIRVVDTDGREIEIAFGTTPIGGYLPIRVDERDDSGIVQARWYGRIETNVRDAFITTGFLHWRSNSIFTGTPSMVDSISLRTGPNGVSLQHDSGGWSIAEPFVTGASNAKVSELAGSLLGLESVGFVDAVDDGILNGFESPIAVVTMNLGDESTTMTIGSQADMGGSEVFGRIQRPDGNAIVRLRMEDLAKLTATPEAYIDLIPIDVSAPSITSIEIRGADSKVRLRAQRRVGQWTIDGAAATVQYEQALDRLVQVLTAQPAGGTKFFGVDQASPEMAGSIVGFDSDGQTVFDVGFGLDSSEAGLRLLIVKSLSEGQGILWICTSDEAGGTGVWLGAMASRRAP